MAGVMVTYTSWRAILWLQAGMIGAGLVLSLLAIQYNEDDKGVWSTATFPEMLALFNPIHVLKLMAYPNVSFAVSIRNRTRM